MESLIHQVPEQLLYQPHQPLSPEEAENELQAMRALIAQVLATDNQQGPSSESFDLDPRPGHILLRNNSQGDSLYSQLEEAEASFHGVPESGMLECKFRRFSAQGSLIRVEILKAQSRATSVDLLRRVWKLESGERMNFFHIDLTRPERSYFQSLNSD